MDAEVLAKKYNLAVLRKEGHPILEGPAEQLEVVGAAIRDHDGQVFTVPPPGRHHDVLRVMAETFNRPQLPQAEQGFLLSDGRFARRKPARIVAEQAKQLLPREAKLPQLYSEDVW